MNILFLILLRNPKDDIIVVFLKEVFIWKKDV